MPAPRAAQASRSAVTTASSIARCISAELGPLCSCEVDGCQEGEGRGAVRPKTS